MGRYTCRTGSDFATVHTFPYTFCAPLLVLIPHTTTVLVGYGRSHTITNHLRQTHFSLFTPGSVTCRAAVHHLSTFTSTAKKLPRLPSILLLQHFARACFGFLCCRTFWMQFRAWSGTLLFSLLDLGSRFVCCTHTITTGSTKSTTATHHWTDRGVCHP